jgi:hypothetical protein
MTNLPFKNKFSDLTEEQILNIQLGISKGFFIKPDMDDSRVLYESLVSFVSVNFKKLSEIYNLNLPITFGYLTCQILELELQKRQN